MLLSTYKVAATHMVTGEQTVFDIQAMDAGEALWKVERHGVWAADDFTLDEEAE